MIEKCDECGCIMIEKYVHDGKIWFRCRNGHWKWIEDVKNK